MYFQITQKCNMSCEHCCYRCSMDGKHMTRRIWKQGIQFMANYTDSVSIGGGEPTLHPDFWAILGECMGTFEYVWLATNGSQTETALKLANLARKGVIGCALSQDYWHDPIAQKVIDAFTRKDGEYSRNESDGREIRDVGQRQENMAPFRDPEDGGDPKNCPCDTIVITSSGILRACGCLDAPVVGNIFKGYTLPEREDLEIGQGCWKESQKIYAELGLTNP